MPVTGAGLVRRWAPTKPRAQVAVPLGWPEFSLDVSNYQGVLGDQFFQSWTRRGFGGLIVQAGTGYDGISYTGRQLQAALDHGWQIASYVWCSPGDSMRDARLRQRLELLDGFVRALDFLALDVEEHGVQAEDVDADLLRCDDLKGDTPMYTGRHVFERAGWVNQRYWAERRLWDSLYDGIPDIDAGWRPYGGWYERWLKQYSDDPLDLNVSRNALARRSRARSRSQARQNRDPLEMRVFPGS